MNFLQNMLTICCVAALCVVPLFWAVVPVSLTIDIDKGHMWQRTLRCITSGVTLLDLCVSRCSMVLSVISQTPVYLVTDMTKT